MGYIILMSALFVGGAAYLLAAGASIVQADDDIQDGRLLEIRRS